MYIVCFLKSVDRCVKYFIVFKLCVGLGPFVILQRVCLTFREVFFLDFPLRNCIFHVSLRSDLCINFLIFFPSEVGCRFHVSLGGWITSVYVTEKCHKPCPVISPSPLYTKCLLFCLISSYKSITSCFEILTVI